MRKIRFYSRYQYRFRLKGAYQTKSFQIGKILIRVLSIFTSFFKERLTIHASLGAYFLIKLLKEREIADFFKKLAFTSTGTISFLKSITKSTSAPSLLRQ